MKEKCQHFDFSSQSWPCRVAHLCWLTLASCSPTAPPQEELWESIYATKFRQLAVLSSTQIINRVKDSHAVTGKQGYHETLSGHRQSRPLPVPVLGITTPNSAQGIPLWVVQWSCIGGWVWSRISSYKREGIIHLKVWLVSEYIKST